MINVSLSDVRASTARYFEMDERSLCDDTRFRHIVVARQLGMYVCRDLTGLSYEKIAYAFSKLDHTTVRHACLKVNAALTRGESSVAIVVTAISDAAKERAAKRVVLETPVPAISKGESNALHA